MTCHNCSQDLLLAWQSYFDKHVFPNLEKGKFVPEFLFWLVNIPLYETHINITGRRLRSTDCKSSLK